MRVAVTALTVTLATAACSGGDSSEEQARLPTSADSVAMAEAMYDEAGFDTISWETHTVALERGAVVWRFSCRKCHGEGGAGDGGFVVDGDTLRPPTFLADDFRFAEDRVGLRHQIYTGTESSMPHWGPEGLPYRDIDAVSFHILETLRSAGG